jgi:hypothetical protein
MQLRERRVSKQTSGIDYHPKDKAHIFYPNFPIAHPILGSKTQAV